jgi:hypothetical protein
MPNLFGHIGIADTDRVFNDTRGQETVWAATTELFQRWNQDLDDALALFVEMRTEAFKERYKLPGGGYLQEEGFDPTAPSGAVKASGHYDVAYPLRSYGASLGYTDVSLGYMTMAEYSTHIQTIFNQNNNTVFNRLLYAIFNNAPPPFLDPLHGSLTLVPLANGDATVYPPLIGSEAGATANHYLAPGYLESEISGTNNPFVPARDLLEQRWGFPQGGAPIVSLVNTSAVPYISLMPGFVEAPTNMISYGDNVTLTTTNFLAHPSGSRVVGNVDGVMVVEWPRIPSGWIVTLHTSAPKPVKQRQDPADTGLGSGLILRATDYEHPFTTAYWRHRFGFGVGNRLSVVVTALNDTATYTVPAAYA